MKANAPSYRGYRFPPEIISHAVWLYHRFCLSFRDVEDLLAKRGIFVSHETIRQWCRKFGPAYARRLTRQRGRLGDTWHLDELFVTIRGRRHYLWRAVDEDGDTIDILLLCLPKTSSAQQMTGSLQGRMSARPIICTLRGGPAGGDATLPEPAPGSGSAHSARPIFSRNGSQRGSSWRLASSGLSLRESERPGSRCR